MSATRIGSLFVMAMSIGGFGGALAPSRSYGPQDLSGIERLHRQDSIATLVSSVRAEKAGAVLSRRNHRPSGRRPCQTDCRTLTTALDLP